MEDTYAKELCKGVGCIVGILIVIAAILLFSLKNISGELVKMNESKSSRPAEGRK